MSTIEAASLAASISDLTAGSSRATIAEALQIIINARQLPGTMATRADVAEAAAAELGRETSEVPQDLTEMIWGKLPPMTPALNDANLERVKDLVCESILDMTHGAAL